MTAGDIERALQRARQFSIRPFIATDAPLLADLYPRSVRMLGPRAYTPEQVEAWASIAPAAELMLDRCSDGRAVLVATDEGDRPIGYGDLERDGHLDFLYCAPEAAGRGVGSAIYRAVEAQAFEWQLLSIRVEASELAKPLFDKHGFDKHGFEMIGRNDLSINGVHIHNYRMVKRLKG